MDRLGESQRRRSIDDRLRDITRMITMAKHTTSRRAFLAFVAGSPLLAAAGVPADLRQRLAAGTVSSRDLIGVGEAMALARGSGTPAH